MSEPITSVHRRPTAASALANSQIDAKGDPDAPRTVRPDVVSAPIHMAISDGPFCLKLTN